LESLSVSSSTRCKLHTKLNKLVYFLRLHRNQVVIPITVHIGARPELVLAALLHDIGQIIPLEKTKEVRMTLNQEDAENVGRIGHETIGAQYLHSLGFSDTVCRLVNSHVAAKR
jgi:putative nucleotidyltransferase with HDIG domain